MGYHISTEPVKIHSASSCRATSVNDNFSDPEASQPRKSAFVGAGTIASRDLVAWLNLHVGFRHVNCPPFLVRSGDNDATCHRHGRAFPSVTGSSISFEGDCACRVGLCGPVSRPLIPSRFPE